MYRQCGRRKKSRFMKPEYRIDKKCKSIGYGIAVSDAFLALIICSAVQIYLYAENINLNIIYPAFSSLESVTAAIALKLSE